MQFGVEEFLPRFVVHLQPQLDHYAGLTKRIRAAVAEAVTRGLDATDSRGLSIAVRFSWAKAALKRKNTKRLPPTRRLSVHMLISFYAERDVDPQV
jgi:hypothetical protein